MPDLNGLLLVDKPVGLTSHDVVDRIRGAAKIRRIGHTGTLDPNATGLLILCLGKATRLSEHLTGLDKTYEGVLRLGIVTDSYDIDGKVVSETDVPDLDAAAIQSVCDRFVGDIEQIPPMVSAVKIGGQRLYKLARRGEEVERPPRQVTVHAFDVLSVALPDVTVRVRCTSGCYVRSLCHDAGQLLGCGAMLASLRRTAVGDRDVADALPVEDFTGPDVVHSRLLPLDDALDLPAVAITEMARPILDNGGMLYGSHLRQPCTVNEGWVQVKSGSGHLLALGTVEPSAMGPCIRLRRVLA
jgi:tRNA pseudouridine55 synthase